MKVEILQEHEKCPPDEELPKAVADAVDKYARWSAKKGHEPLMSVERGALMSFIAYLARGDN